MTFLKNTAFIFIALTVTACGNSTETTPSNDDPTSDTQAHLTSDESGIIPSDGEIKDLTQFPQEDDGDKTGNKSVYSNLALNACELVESGAQSTSKTYKCGGYKDWDIYASDSEGQFTLAVGQAPDFLMQRQPLNTPGNKIEWRLKDGQPHAIIYPLNLESSIAGESQETLLVVASLPAKGQSGCAQALVKQGSEQRDAARRYADMLNDASDCPNDPAIIGAQ